MDAPQIPLKFETLPAAGMLAAATAFHERMRRRRSVRDFAPTPVPREIIETCVRTAGTAPNGANLQPWHFVVVGDAEVKRRIREAAEAEERAFYHGRAPAGFLETLRPIGTNAQKPYLEIAPWLIAVFAVNSYEDANNERKLTYYPKESVGIATGLLLSALHLAGLATLTHTPSPMGFLNQILGRPASEKPFLLIVVGHPAADATVPAITKKPLEQIATFL